MLQNEAYLRCLLLLSFDARNDAGGKERAYTSGGTPNAGEETLVDKRFASIKLELENLKEVRRDLESKIAKMQVLSLLPLSTCILDIPPQSGASAACL